MTFYLVHNRKELPADLSGIDAVVFGHSYRYLQEERDGILWLNPGSCGPRRFHQEITMMTAEIADGKLRVKKLAIPTRPHDEARASFLRGVESENGKKGIRMKAEQFSMGGVPAVLYGDPADQGYLFLHGQMGRKGRRRRILPGRRAPGGTRCCPSTCPATGSSGAGS